MATNQKQKYDVTAYGATVCDALQTASIQRTIDECFINGGGVVVIPTGIFRTGGIRLRSNVTLYLESGAILLGSTDPEDYYGYLEDTLEPVDRQKYDSSVSRSMNPFSRWSNALIRALDGENIGIIGEKGSYISGANCYDPQGEASYRGPHAISIWNCENVHLQGYTVTDSANWAHAIFQSKNINIHNLTVYGGHDGIDLFGCNDVLVSSCSFYTGDDSIAGFANQDITIKDCHFNSACSALRFGGTRILIENCISTAPSRFGFRKNLLQDARAAGKATDGSCRHNMLNFFLYYCDHRTEVRSTPGDIVIRNCDIQNPDRLFGLCFDVNQKWCCNRSLADICFQNCKVSGVSKPINLHGDVNDKTAFVLENTQIAVREGFEDIPFMEAEHFSRISLKGVQLTGYNDPRICIQSEGQISIDNSSEIRIS